MKLFIILMLYHFLSHFRVNKYPFQASLVLKLYPSNNSIWLEIVHNIGYTQFDVVDTEMIVIACEVTFEACFLSTRQN